MLMHGFHGLEASPTVRKAPPQANHFPPRNGARAARLSLERNGAAKFRGAAAAQRG